MIIIYLACITSEYIHQRCHIWSSQYLWERGQTIFWPPITKRETRFERLLCEFLDVVCGRSSTRTQVLWFQSALPPPVPQYKHITRSLRFLFLSAKYVFSSNLWNFKFYIIVDNKVSDPKGLIPNDKLHIYKINW